jgi:energy-coupling factor transporter ATP-binding protein EcfA2
MDPHSRRAVWALLRKKRKGRVTLLTTHFMDEAEILSDRIVVMKEGKRCGSTTFLKNRFGLGYNLTVVLLTKGSASQDEQSQETGLLNDGQESTLTTEQEKLTVFLRRLIPNTEVVRISGRELTFRFPHASEELFPKALDSLEAQREVFGIGAYGITNCSLEEVFLELANQKVATKKQRSPESESEYSADTESSPTLSVGSRPIPPSEDTMLVHVEYQHLSPLGQIGVLYTKRATIQKRDMKGGFFQLVLPVIAMATVLFVLMLNPACKLLSVLFLLLCTGVSCCFLFCASTLTLSLILYSHLFQSNFLNSCWASNPIKSFPLPEVFSW